MAPNEKSEPVNGSKRYKQNPGVPSDMLCGLGPIKPNFLQSCVRMGAFAGIYSISGLTTSVLSMYIVSQITTIEKQFGLSSSQSGLLLSCNDIGFLLTTLIFSYIARKVHIPRTLWVTSMLYGTAGLVCSIPYFISRDYVLRQTSELIRGASRPDAGLNVSFGSGSSRSNTPMCHQDESGVPYSFASLNGSTCEAKDTDEYGVGKPNEYTQTTIVIIALGMIIQGVAKAPRYPFLTTYVDDNCKRKNTAMYMGIISGVGIFGPAIAFSVGGLFSRTHVTLEDVPLSPRHPAWIGAWWLGYIIFGIISMIVSLPLLFFPRRMRPRAVPKRTAAQLNRSLKKRIIGFWKSLLRLITNTVYMPMVSATCVLLFGIGGMIAFSAKYLETQFFIPAWKANILLGVMSVVSASAGTVVGGFVVSKRKLSPMGCIKMIITATIITTVLSATGFVLGCSNADIAGYNTQNNHISTNSSCSTSCGCDSVTYFPVCGSNNVNYMSPCHAGCADQNGMVFGNCSCVGLENATAVAGLCDTECNMMYPFLILNIFGSFFGTLVMIPGFIIVIRSVRETDKPMAVGFSSLLTTLCGWFAGPVAFGKVVDTTCVLWSSSCSGGGACALYDNDILRFRKHLFEILPRIVALVLYIIVFFRARVKTDWTTEAPNVLEEKDVKQAMISGDELNMAKSPADWNKSPIFKGDKPFANKTFGV